MAVMKTKALELNLGNLVESFVNKYKSEILAQ